MAAARRLASHGRFPYSPIIQRPAFSWPRGRRLAVYIGLNIETFEFGKGLGAELAPKANDPDVLNWSWREYGNRVGAWRLLDLLEELEWGPVGAIINTACYDECPELIEALRRRGDEVIGHGHTNSDRQGDMSVEEERAIIQACTARMVKEEGGVAPKGWLSPWISESHTTNDLLHEAGYAYTLNWAMDDMPVRVRTTACSTTRSGEEDSSSASSSFIWSIPYPQEVNDIPSIVTRKDSASDFADMIIDSFEEQKEQSRKQPLVFGIALHPYLVGQPHRLRHLRRALTHIMKDVKAEGEEEEGGVWITTPREIVRYIEDNKIPLP